MKTIKDYANILVLANDYSEIHLSKADATVEAIIDKQTGRHIEGEQTRFFSLHTREAEIPVTGLTLSGETITVQSAAGCFDVAVQVLDRYFTFEILTELPTGVFRAYIAHAKYDYDYTDKQNTGAVAIAMTIWMNPTYYPDAKSLETKGEVIAHLGSKEAKLALIVAPIADQQSIIKEACLAIDRNKGICSLTGGAWGRDSRLNFTNYTIQVESSKEYILDNLDFFKSLGVDFIDIHQGGGSYRQGDFKFMRYENGAQFKQHVSDVLKANGMLTGLHTYAFYIAGDCETILSDPVYQSQLKVMASFTLAEDVDADADFFPTVESTDGISMDRGFCVTNSSLMLIDNEIVIFVKDKNGIRVTRRGWAETKPAPHKKGAVIKHLEGLYGCITPVFGSDLFYQIARNTAKAYNEGGFNMIYLDAIDGVICHSERGVEDWFYMAAFVCEVLKYCDNDPVLEGAYFLPSMYAARGRVGAWDPPYRSYKQWNNKHAAENAAFIDRYSAPILGWYDYYPMTDHYPGNEHTKYHHTDSIEHLGSLAVMYDYPNVFNGLAKESLVRYAGMRRNIALYKQYDDLRKAQYFDADYRQKLIHGPYEYHLTKTDDDQWRFVEKDYQIAKLYDLNDPARSTASFQNPFGAQIPFIRIEAMLSTAKHDPVVMLDMDENRPLTEQPLACRYDGERNFANHLAKVVRVHGNGKNGAKICIKTRCATNSELGYGEYIIDVDFDGWREFILLESDNGERTDHGFEINEGRYAIHRSSLNNDRLTGIEVETEGDMTGVRMSPIVAYEHTYEVLKNPTVTIGDTAVMFECELMSSDFIEFDGQTAKVIDRFGNEKPIWFSSNLQAPSGSFTASLTARALNRNTPRAQLTIAFTGKEIE